MFTIYESILRLNIFPSFKIYIKKTNTWKTKNKYLILFNYTKYITVNNNVKKKKNIVMLM